jgi:hypothetical protein
MPVAAKAALTESGMNMYKKCSPENSSEVTLYDVAKV